MLSVSLFYSIGYLDPTPLNPSAITVHEIPFQISINRALESTSVSSDMTFKDFVQIISSKLSILPQDLNIAYKTSWKPNNIWKLSEEGQWEKLVEHAVEALEGQIQTRSQAPFSIRITDQRSSDEKKKSAARFKEANKSGSRVRLSIPSQYLILPCPSFFSNFHC